MLLKVDSRSTPSPSQVMCFQDSSEYLALVNNTIQENGIEWSGNFTDPQDIARLLAQAPQMQDIYEEIGSRCSSAINGTTLMYIGTAATARDMAALADALDGPGSPVNYWGISYGTLLGTWFVNSACIYCLTHRTSH